MNFKERVSPSTTVKYCETIKPTVYITEEALNKMFIYTDEVKEEVGWLGTAYREGNQFLIRDVFLFKQQVHGATTEITPEGLAEFAETLLTQEGGMEIWNNMKMWGHSHVNMGITPSTQDNTQMEEFSRNGHDFFIRLICNKKGELGVDVYDYETGLEFHNAKWLIYSEETMEEAQYTQQIEQLQVQLQRLQDDLEQLKGEKVEALREEIKPEIAEKVKKFTYTTTRPYTKNAYNKPITPQYHKPSTEPGRKGMPDAIDGVKNTVWSFFSQKDLFMLANTCLSYEDFLEEMYLDGHDKYLSDNDFNTVWNKVTEMQASSYTWGHGGVY